jgi:hypothetical protein
VPSYPWSYHSVALHTGSCSAQGADADPVSSAARTAVVVVSMIGVSVGVRQPSKEIAINATLAARVETAVLTGDPGVGLDDR